MFDKKINPWEILVLKNYYPHAMIKHLPMRQWEVYHQVLALDRYFLRHGADVEFNCAYVALMEPLALAGILTHSVLLSQEQKFQYLLQLNLFAQAVVSSCPRLTFLVTSFADSMVTMLRVH